MESKSQNVDYVKWFIRFFSTEAGRDKFNKFIQFGARYMAARHLAADPKSEIGAKYKATAALFANARKLDNLFKFVNEYDKIADALKVADPTQKTLMLTRQFAMMVYWFFDNVAWLTNTKFIAPNEDYARWSNTAWFIALVCNLILDSLALRKNLREDKRVREENLAQVQAGNSDPKAFSARRAALRAQRLNLLLAFPRNLGDLLVAGQGAKINDKIFGGPLSESTIGLAGMIASAIIVYQVAKQTRNV